ncbi:hypothetical protein N657DRAFT_268694 [Parathielavia appendiculata]|uniref:Uncharacterized protein n=1 Tax=Parathielavia appendiculata TaxID=2587402 RepID=A0AAN6U3I0_9PEZI|nr:hypothetical protein N657DRAFT_268694 [Parathielavia appendiculata]
MSKWHFVTVEGRKSSFKRLASTRTGYLTVPSIPVGELWEGNWRAWQGNCDRMPLRCLSSADPTSSRCCDFLSPGEIPSPLHPESVFDELRVHQSIQALYLVHGLRQRHLRHRVRRRHPPPHSHVKPLRVQRKATMVRSDARDQQPKLLAVIALGMPDRILRIPAGTPPATP